MAELDYWHPVALDEELKPHLLAGPRPLPVGLCGEKIVLFRTESGRVGALGDRCPHRGMPLSEGKICGNHIECAYHGWRWAPDGEGQSPGNPKVAGRAQAFAVTERLGAVWLKNLHSDVRFPALDVGGHHPLTSLRRRVAAPLELVVDNFIEVEHTGQVHALLGYETERMSEIDVEVTIGDESVRVINRGPQRPMPAALRALIQVNEGDLFVDAWTTFFQPVHTIYDQYWLDPNTRERRPNWLRIAVFFNPVAHDVTDLFVFAFSAQPPWGRFGVNMALRPLMKQLVAVEVDRDVELVEKLAASLRPDETSLRGHTLGRFDKALTAARKRIDRLYRS